jgi:hypothetical protein
MKSDVIVLSDIIDIRVTPHKVRGDIASVLELTVKLRRICILCRRGLDSVLRSPYRSACFVALVNAILQ